MRVGIFGGSFDPVHEGHLRTIGAAQEHLGLSRVIYVPARQSPWKNLPETDPRHRVAMLGLALAGHPSWTISFEEPDREPPSFTVDTLRAFTARWPGDDLWLLMGTDALASLDRWREPTEIVRLARIGAFHREPQVGAGLVLPAIANLSQRLELFDAGSVRISSTDLRDALARGENPGERVPATVAEYITKHGLYGSRVTRR